MFRKILHSPFLFYMAMKIVNFSLPRSHKRLNHALPIQEITFETTASFTNCIDTKRHEIIDVSLEGYTISEYATTPESLILIIESLLNAQKDNPNAYIKTCGITVNAKNFLHLKLVVKLLAKLSRRVHFFIAYGNKNNPFLYAYNTGVILHGCKFNNDKNAHIKQVDNYPTTINHSLLKKKQRSESNTIKAVTPRSTIFNFPIDAVYTWAGQGKNIDTPGITSLHESVFSQSRFSNFDELKYSLRSLSMNTVFFNNIYIVIADDPPSWLNINHPKIKLIRHSDIFKSPSNLPTYNSHAIESQLHHIKGLSEHFIYLNDDIFFLSPCYAIDFFHPNGIAKQFIEKNFSIPLSLKNTNLIPADKACDNSRKIMVKQFGTYFSFKYKHTPFAINKSDALQLEEIFYEKFKTTSAATHRSKKDIATTSSLVHFYSYHRGRSIPSNITNLLINLDSPKLPIQTLKLLTKKSIKTLCINENNLSHPHPNRFYAPSAQIVKTLFPLKSDFEN